MLIRLLMVIRNGGSGYSDVPIRNGTEILIPVMFVIKIILRRAVTAVVPGCHPQGNSKGHRHWYNGGTELAAYHQRSNFIKPDDKQNNDDNK